MKTQDIVKLFVAFLLLMAGVIAFYKIPESQFLLRTGAVAAGVILAVVATLISSQGKTFVSYAKASVAEARKVVWPTRQETNRLTIMVFVFVLLLGLYMLIVDSSLSWLISFLLGQHNNT